ncbi:hypothetical protein FNV43_RR26183 [Rhamnella rubrinervis]|uniref:Protein PHYTOCHROME KINASE SUBSTRATE 1-like n=1 Tax=Rhamnella rubrinervis TaxID=2594499 RepID=A0A8K0DUI1_9ROSA|nr:hypothetical protein FNV43_RR26183 [Rhamnella rubrinervis]
MNMVTVTSACNTSLSQSFPFQSIKTGTADASLTSYLSNLGESSRSLSPIIHTSTQDEHKHLGREKEEDEEIGVFGAEKYFNGVIDRESPKIGSTGARKYHYKKDHERAKLDHMKTKLQSAGTPSVRSELSWNSQSTLLQSGLRNLNYRKKKTKRWRNQLQKGDANFGAIHGKSRTISPIKTGLVHDIVDAVQIKSPLDSRVLKEEVIMNTSKRMDKLGFSVPSSKPGAGNLAVKIPFQEDDHDHKLRKSLEVFGSPVMEQGSRSLSLERKLTMLSWDITPRVDVIEFNANSAGIYNDSESDASSDLFEIESLSGKSTNNPFLARHPSDDTTSGCVTPTTCYAPSEASIEWSVVTASAADYSAMSDSEEQRSAIHVSSPMKTTQAATATTTDLAKTTTNKEIQRRRASNILLGCKSHKAVRVAGDACRANDKILIYHEPHVHRRSDSSISMTRFQAQNKLTDFSSRLGQHTLPTHSLPRSLHTPHNNSHLLYIQ